MVKRVGRALWRGWKAFWMKVAWVQACLLLLVIYFVPLGVTSLVCKLFRRDFLRLRRRGALAGGTTFWVDRPPLDTSMERARRQF